MKKFFSIFLIASILVFNIVCNENSSVSEEGLLLERLNSSSKIMWFGAHPDDELYTGGVFGYFTRELKRKMVIVSLYYNPDFVESNKKSSIFLNNAIYTRIQEKMYKEENVFVDVRCNDWKELDEVVEELVDLGVKDYVKKIIKTYKPDIVFGFESTNGFRHSCQHVSFAKVVDRAVKELRNEGEEFFYYYVLNRDPNWFGEENMDPLPVTDEIELSQKMWEYKLYIFDIYSQYYPVLGDEEFRERLQHREWFREVEFTEVGEKGE